MARTATLQLRLTPAELEKLRTAAEKRGWSMAQLIREFIRQLPQVESDRLNG